MVEHLCLEGQTGCGQEEPGGGHEVYMPEPIAGMSGHGYRVRISEIGGRLNAFACSDEFYLSSSAGAAMIESFHLGEPSIAVVSPTKDSVAMAGEEYTIEVIIFYFFYAIYGRVFCCVKQPHGQHVRKRRSQ